ncbi:hypothetical protein ACUXCC_004587 [Cytobacillus horneckiae]|uniref:hypothetical protein n=1 Tax=Cytobacillus horneckiae TaxID=549687 RepID=UPI0019D1B802|nr:hypothetical protein [Cytobacillus horneckiae]MBN6887311.1 hypothetical protein [Cytobacillus horneckiae]
MEQMKMVNNLAQEVLPNTDIVVFDELNKRMTLDSFEFVVTGSSSTTFPVLHFTSNNSNNFTNQIFHTINPSGTRWYATPTRLSNDGSAYFETMAYDTGAGLYKFNLKTPVILPNGGRLAFRAASGYGGGDMVLYKAIYRVEQSWQ